MERKSNIIKGGEISVSVLGIVLLQVFFPNVWSLIDIFQKLVRLVFEWVNKNWVLIFMPLSHAKNFQLPTEF